MLHRAIATEPDFSQFWRRHRARGTRCIGSFSTISRALSSMSFIRPRLPNVRQRPSVFDQVEKLEAISVRDGPQPCDWVRGAAVDNHICAAAPFDVVARELSSDFGKRRVGFGHSAQYAAGVPRGRGLGEQADSICRTGVRLSRFSAPILPMRCNTLIFSPTRLGLRCRKDFCLGSRGSLNCSHVERGQTFWCCSRALSWRQVGEPSRRRCASWDANAIPTSVPSTVSLIGQSGRPGPRRVSC